MRRLALLAVLALGLAACGGGTGTPKDALKIAFGRVGGSIMSYKITIAPGGAVTVQGNPPVKPPASLTSAQDEALSVQVRNAIPMLTSVVCAHTFPDEASQFITALGKTVYVRGDCDPDFRKLYDALSNALELK